MPVAFTKQQHEKVNTTANARTTNLFKLVAPQHLILARLLA